MCIRDRIIDLQEFKYNFECLKDSRYLKGQITIEPEYFQDKKLEEYSEEVISEETTIKFSIYPEDVKMSLTNSTSFFPEELNTPLRRFRKDYSPETKTAFLMMKFEDTPIPVSY